MTDGAAKKTVANVAVLLQGNEASKRFNNYRNEINGQTSVNIF